MVTTINFIIDCNKFGLKTNGLIVLAPAYLATPDIIISFPPYWVNPLCPFAVRLSGAKQNIDTTIEPDTTSQIYSWTPLDNLGPNDFSKIKMTAILS